jgi:hypothetical protein
METRLKNLQKAIDSVMKQEVDNLDEWYQSMYAEAVTASVVLFVVLMWVVLW